MNWVYTKKEYRIASLIRARRYSKRWRSKNPEAVKRAELKRRKNGKAGIANRKWKSRNRTKVNSQMLKWRLNNPNKWRALMARSKYRRYHLNPGYRLKELAAGRIRKALIKQGISKQNRTLELTGVTISQLKAWLESKFKPGMSWQNMGRFGWHVDHIKPCSSFDLTNPSELVSCFHFTNLQPLWWRENLAKGAKCAV